MIIAAFDVCYPRGGGASAAAVLFRDFKDAVPTAEYTQMLPDVADYLPGEFYRRELPGILALLAKVKESLDQVIIDGYVKLGNQPGLGQRLFERLNGTVPVIGVAKSKFSGSEGVEILRGKSRRPLYITCAGVAPQLAAGNIQKMHGPFRIPTLLKRVDALAGKKSV
jgi:deoxyribonuclease V